MADNGFWFKCCWGNHAFLKHPIEGFHGVHYGVLSIGAKQKPYKLWLQAVKDKWNNGVRGAVVSD